MLALTTVKQGVHHAVGVLAMIGLVGGALGLGGCKDDALQAEGQRCGGEWGGCQKGLRCSFKKKRCYRPVDCAHLERRLKACLAEVVSAYAPKLDKLPAQKRARLLERIGQHLQTDMVDHCKYDAAAYQKKHGTKPTLTKSYGQDPRQKKITACLKQQGCRPFATCMLELARVVGSERPRPNAQAVFPITPPRPVPVAPPDGGVPAGADGMKPGADAMKPGADGMKPGADAMKPGAAAMDPTPASSMMAPASSMMTPTARRTAPAMPAARPAMPTPRPR